MREEGFVILNPGWLIRLQEDLMENIPRGKVVPLKDIPFENPPLFEYIEKEIRGVPPIIASSGRPPSITARRTRGFKWFLNGRYEGAWVYCVDDFTDFDKLATALYIARRMRRSKLWTWWYRTFYKIHHFFVGAGVTGDEWPNNLS